MFVLVLESKSLLSYLRGEGGKGENSIVDTPLEHSPANKHHCLQVPSSSGDEFKTHCTVISKQSEFKYFTYLQKLFLGLFPLQMWLKYLLYVILPEVYFVVFFAEYGTILEIRLNPKVYKQLLKRHLCLNVM